MTQRNSYVASSAVVSNTLMYLKWAVKNNQCYYTIGVSNCRPLSQINVTLLLCAGTLLLASLLLGLGASGSL